ncbi:X-ray radiation resistance-associated protein 1 [Synchiropus splendidus]|uniref:X-ray radiation resistance-associated protein 1 n=1 Tax=Synchiropus splendidus TaxID=270530 RepID=UPI00237D6FAD|nr:X-ray radiation resistance-associated protein 1 [Synchiropus splendidus]
MELANKHFEGLKNSNSYQGWKSSPRRGVLKKRVHWLEAFREAEEQKYSGNIRNKCVIREPVPEPHHSTALDGPFLLRSQCVDRPSQLYYVNISERGLDSVKCEDLALFDKVVSIDASANSFSLGSFGCFASLRELDLSLNGLKTLAFEAKDFPRLQVLDLSFNSLSADDIIPIGRFPRLKVLHLTGNQLSHLPPDLGSTSKSTKALFSALEVLLLDDNILTSQVFRSLAQLQRLKYLNLKRNLITEIPYFSEYSKRDELATSLKPAMQINTGSKSPFPELQYLNLSANQIVEEEALLAAALFPELKELEVHSNPMKTRRNGGSLLALFLEEEHGVTVNHKEEPGVEKSPTRILAVKVKEKVKKSERKVKTAESLPVDLPGFSVSQASEILEGEQVSPSQDDSAGPGGFSVQDLLKEAKPNSDEVETVGIQTAVRMLDFTLKNLTVYRDPKPKLDSVQMPFRGTAERVRKLPPLGGAKRTTEKVDKLMKEMKASTTITKAPLSRALQDKRHRKEASLLMRDLERHYKTIQEKTMDQDATQQKLAEKTPDQRWAKCVPLPVFHAALRAKVSQNKRVEL